MIKFFRKIRQKLLSDGLSSGQAGKFLKYLLYAIGEVLLVVVGILIAVNINNSNEAEKLRKKEVTLLNEMKQNLLVDLADLAFNIDGNMERIRANEIILETLTERRPMVDSLKKHYGSILGNFQLSENTAAWENLKSVGLDLISNDSLRNAISQIYTVKYGYLENLERSLDDKYQWNNLYPQILESVNIVQVWKSGEPVDHEALFDNRKFHETLKMNLFFRHFMQDQYTSIHNDVKNVLQRIERHLQSLND